MSRDYLAEWVRQLWASEQNTVNVDSLTTAELTRLIILFADGSTTEQGQS